MGNTAGVHRTGAPEGNEREAARIDAPPDGHGANGLGHRLVANLEDAQRRTLMSAQLSRDARLAQADDVVDNGGPPDAIEPQVDTLDRVYRDLATRAGNTRPPPRGALGQNDG